MNHRQIERRIALLLPDRRADVDTLIPDIESDALDRVIIDPHVYTMRIGTQSLVHFALHGMVAAACLPIDNSTDNSADNEVGAKILGKAIALVNVAFSITDVNTPIGSPQQGNRLTEIIEPADALLCFNQDPRRVDLLLELGSTFELVAAREFDWAQTKRKFFLGHDQA